MYGLTEKVAYLQGLTEGLDIKEDTKEGKLLLAIVDVLDELADSLEELQEAHDELCEFVEDMDDDLTAVEDDLYEDEDDEDVCDCGCEDDDCDCCADEDGLVDVVCPKCGETVCFDSDILDADELIEVVCPVCDEVVFTNDEDDDCCDCGCEDDK